MRVTAAVFVLAGLMSQGAAAADLARGSSQADTHFYQSADRTPVVVDEVWLRSGCPKDKDCLPPRVMPLDFTRYTRYVTIQTPVDPRFADRYR